MFSGPPHGMCVGDKHDSQDAGLPNRILNTWPTPSSDMHVSGRMRAVLRVLVSKKKKSDLKSVLTEAWEGVSMDVIRMSSIFLSESFSASKTKKFGVGGPRDLISEWLWPTSNLLTVTYFSLRRGKQFQWTLFGARLPLGHGAYANALKLVDTILNTCESFRSSSFSYYSMFI